MIATVVLLIVVVQIFQDIGMKISLKQDKRR
jgi:ABC-type methionine transport system permease subunit